jgi:thiamine biosynthesis protein ThiS
MRIELNGEPSELSEQTTVGHLLEQQDLDRPGVAVAVNREVIRRADWTQTVLRNGDRVEIIHAVQGG